MFHSVEVGFDGALFRVLVDGGIVLDVPSGSVGEPAGRFGFGSRSADVAAEGVFVVAEEE